VGRRFCSEAWNDAAIFSWMALSCSAAFAVSRAICSGGLSCSIPCPRLRDARHRLKQLRQLGRQAGGGRRRAFRCALSQSAGCGDLCPRPPPER